MAGKLRTTCSAPSTRDQSEPDAYLYPASIFVPVDLPLFVPLVRCHPHVWLVGQNATFHSLKLAVHAEKEGYLERCRPEHHPAFFDLSVSIDIVMMPTGAGSLSSVWWDTVIGKPTSSVIVGPRRLRILLGFGEPLLSHSLDPSVMEAMDA